MLAYRNFPEKLNQNVLLSYMFSVAISGRLNRVLAPLVFGGCVCGDGCFFDGYMDTVSRYMDIK